ncbi:MAG TPA: hypothetical protein VF194_04250 [Ferrovibrio sp.]|uniref:hypothetical protein n=1 Tax=Ferrovibrio sp. TaxID=1917215 RepID=UPI002ED691A2
MLRYYASPKRDQIHSPEPLDITIHRHVFDVETARSGGRVIGTFDETWQPDIRRVANSIRPGEEQWAIVNNNENNPSFMIQMWHRYSPEQLKTATSMKHNDIFFYRDPGNKEHDLLSRRFYRLFGKFATNRDQTSFWMPERRFWSEQKKGSLFWLGYDAIRWAKEDPQRVFFYNTNGWAFRPDDAGVIRQAAAD